MKLKAVIAQYVAFRKSLGARFENSEGRLNAFWVLSGALLARDEPPLVRKQ